MTIINGIILYSYVTITSFISQTLYYPNYYIIDIICKLKKYNSCFANDYILNKNIYTKIANSFYFFANYILNYKICYYGDLIEDNDRLDLYICNHITYLDSLFIPITLLSSTNCYKRLRFFMNKIFRKLPVVKEAIFFNKYYLLSKNIIDDKGLFESFDDEIKTNYNYNTSLFIYPEGTMYFETSLKKYHDYCESKNIKPFENLIHPRYKGTYKLIQSIKNLDMDVIGFFYDITMYYSGVDNKNIKITDFLTFKTNSVHMHIRKIKYSDIPDEEEEFKQWIYNLFKEKDELLKNKDKWIANHVTDEKFKILLTDFINFNLFIISIIYLIFFNSYAYYYFLLSMAISFAQYIF